jgi:hypothetical protein
LLAEPQRLRALRILQPPGFIVRNRIPTGLSADIDFPKAVKAGGLHSIEARRFKPSDGTGLSTRARDRTRLQITR